jgi:hypothetical protein
MYKKIVKWLSSLSTKQLIVIPGLVSLVPISILLLFSKGGYSARPIEDFLIPLTLFILGFIGLPMIIRKEAPGVIVLHGKLAILQGVLIMFCFWIPVMMVIVSSLRKVMP